VRAAPRVLHVAGGAQRLARLLDEPVVAIVGARAASDYGMEVAHALARGLAASGVTVLGALAEGIGAATHEGALHVDGPTVTVMPGGLDVCYPAGRRALYRRIREHGCAISEHPPGVPTSRWCHPLRARILAALAQLTIVVEAEEQPGALAAAHLAQASGGLVGAVPGRVGSPLAAGPHALLTEGAGLVRSAEDALDLLYSVGARPTASPPAPPPPAAPALDERLRAVLDQVSTGRDTLEKLTGTGVHMQETALALAELELRGALGRGDGGRYVRRL
jgi:DNA processing protein